MNKPHVNDTELFKHLKVKVGGYAALSLVYIFYKAISNE